MSGVKAHTTYRSLHRANPTVEAKRTAPHRAAPTADAPKSKGDRVTISPNARRVLSGLELMSDDMSRQVATGTRIGRAGQSAFYNQVASTFSALA